MTANKESDGANSGASISVTDPRLSRLIAWGGIIVAVFIGSGVMWVGMQLVGIKEALASMATPTSATFCRHSYGYWCGV